MTIEELYKKERQGFIRKVLPYLRKWEVAEDIVNEAFTKALSCQHQYDKNRGPLKAWFTKILFSCVWSYIREQKKVPPLYDIDLVLESDLLIYEEEPDLREYVRKTPNTKHRQVLLGYFVLGATYEELSSLSGLTQDNIRKIVQRFRKDEKLESYV